eukprot:9218105-Ditylum_brightwellii.AAC.1
MLQSALKPQKPKNNKVRANSDSGNSNNDLSDDEEEQDDTDKDKPITQEELTNLETVTKELSEDKTSTQVVIEDKQQNSVKTTMTRVMRTRKQKSLQHCCSP